MVLCLRHAHLGIPLKFREEPGAVNMHAPALGEDSEEIALGLGFDADEVARLKEKGRTTSALVRNSSSPC